VRSRTSCEVLDVPALFRRPTEPQPAAFILPSCGRVLRPPHLLDECTTTCDMLRTVFESLVMASCRLVPR
jgi:hypothetical protein